MNRADAIELAHQLTERKAEKILNMNLLLNTVLMDICKRQRFWWRKLDVTFTIKPGLSGAGITQYDFSTLTTTPAITGIAVEEIITIALVSGGSIIITNPPTSPELTPIFDPIGIRQIKQNTVQAQPSRYTMGAVDWKTLVIDPPDATYTAEMTFWAMPMPASAGDTIDAASNEIPLIPPFYHDAIVNGLEARINRRVWGPSDSRYIAANNAYETCILNMTTRQQFTSNYNKQWIDDDSTAYVQSTSPNTP